MSWIEFSFYFIYFIFLFGWFFSFSLVFYTSENSKEKISSHDATHRKNFDLKLFQLFWIYNKISSIYEIRRDAIWRNFSDFPLPTTHWRIVSYRIYLAGEIWSAPTGDSLPKCDVWGKQEKKTNVGRRQYRKNQRKIGEISPIWREICQTVPAGKKKKIDIIIIIFI